MTDFVGRFNMKITNNNGSIPVEYKDNYMKVVLEPGEYCRIKTSTGDVIMNDITEIDFYRISKENKE